MPPDRPPVKSSTHVRLVDSLRDPGCYPHAVSRFSVIETHASWVILTGGHAYKIKKPVDLGFLDYSTLEQRRAACEQELLLNRAWAPELYLEMVPVTGSVEQPRMGGAGAPIEYAVHMREFGQEEQLDRRLAEGRLSAGDMDELAAYVAARHLSATRAPGCPYGDPEEIHRPAMDNFAAMGPLLPLPGGLDALERWTAAEFLRVRRDMQARNAGGWVRDCHGDLHLSNLVKHRDEIMAFDRIEFSEALRWIDVLSDTAFLHMDLLSRGRPDLGYRFLNRYLEATGDYAGLKVLGYYLVYRSLVRAKVALLRAAQLAGPEARRVPEETARRHLSLAGSMAAWPEPRLVLMHGASGSGKTWLSDRLMAELPAIRLRSDVERKRLHGLGALAQSGSAPGAGLYDERATRRTYEALLTMAQAVLDAGGWLIVDAAFLLGWQRALFIEAAARRGVPWHIVACDAPRELLQERVTGRNREGRDASEAGPAVLQRQLLSRETLDDRERRSCIQVDTGTRVDVAALAARLRGAGL